MQIIPTRLKRGSCNYYLLGDTHFGSIACAEESIQEIVDTIAADNHARCSLMGDLSEAFWVDDPRYHPAVQTSSPIGSMETLYNLLKPIAKKIDTILMGNHELKLEKSAGNLTKKLCERLGVPYGTYSAKVEFYNGKAKPEFKFYLTHGRRSISSVSPDPIRRKAYMEFALKRHLQDQAGDCILMAKGHAHKIIIARPLPELYLTNEGNRIRQNYTVPGADSPYIPPEHRFYACTGSFLKSQVIGVSTYSEIAEYGPVQLGCVKATIENYEMCNLEEVRV